MTITNALYQSAAINYNQRKMAAALKIANLLANNNDASGYIIIGRVYEYGGDGVGRDFDKALNAYEKALLLGNYAQAQSSAARVLLRKGGRQNVSKATEYYRRLLRTCKSARPISYFMLGKIHEFYLEPVDIASARSFYLRAGFSGLPSGFAEYARLESMHGSKILGRGLRFVAAAVFPIMRVLFRDANGPSR